jgi:hypothetical protein
VSRIIVYLFPLKLTCTCSRRQSRLWLVGIRHVSYKNKVIPIFVTYRRQCSKPGQTRYYISYDSDAMSSNQTSMETSCAVLSNKVKVTISSMFFCTHVLNKSQKKRTCLVALYIFTSPLKFACTCSRRQSRLWLVGIRHVSYKNKVIPIFVTYRRQCSKPGQTRYYISYDSDAMSSNQTSMETSCAVLPNKVKVTITSMFFCTHVLNKSQKKTNLSSCTIHFYISIEVCLHLFQTTV